MREQAEADLAETMEDATNGFGLFVTLQSPEGLSAALVGLTTDISFVIDPETGVAVSGRTASVTLRISSIVEAGFAGLPRAIANPTEKPWVVVFADIGGTAHTFKVRESNPDRALGVVVCILEVYAP